MVGAGISAGSRFQSPAAHRAPQPSQAATTATGSDSSPRSTMPRRNAGRFVSSFKEE